MGNRCHDSRTGRFISAARGRIQNVQRLADISDDDWAIDEEALAILEAGIAIAIQDGWLPPADFDEPGTPDDPNAVAVVDPWPLTTYMPSPRPKVERWWTRLRGWGHRQVHAATTTATLTLRGWA